jgi:hypothetical protein
VGEHVVVRTMHIQLLELTSISSPYDSSRLGAGH